MKLLFENWRQYLKEVNTTWAPPGTSTQTTSSSASLKEYFNSKGFFFDQYLGGGAHGRVYEIVDKQTGEKMAAKIVQHQGFAGARGANPAKEHANYLYVKNNRAAFSPYSKYLPVVYSSELVNMDNGRVTPTGTPANTVIIIMEKLVAPPRSVIRQFVRSGAIEDFSERDKRMFKNPSILDNILKDTVSSSPIGHLLSDSERKVAVAAVLEKYYASGEEADLGLFQTKYGVSDDRMAVLDRVATTEAINLLLLLFEGIEQALNDRYRDSEAFTTMQMNGVLHTIPNNFIEAYRRPMMTGGVNISPLSALSGRDRGGAGRIEVEQEFPETIGLRKAMDAFHNAGITPKDVHIENIMMRPNTNELVIVDLGLFKLTSH